jgi:hypothetical protein
MSPVADNVMVCDGDAAAFDGDEEEEDEAEETSAAAAAAGSCHWGEGPEPRFAKATLPAPTPTRAARTIVIVRTGRPKRPGRGDGGWEFIDGDDTFGWQRGRPVEWLVVAPPGRRRTLPVTVGLVTLRYLDQGVPARFPPACA